MYVRALNALRINNRQIVSLFGREATRAVRQLSLFCDGDECLDFRHSFVIQGVNAIVRASFAKLFGAGRHIANAMFPEPPVS